MALEISSQIPQKGDKNENSGEKFRFILVFLSIMVSIHFFTSIVHEGVHILSCMVFGGEISRLILIFLGILTEWLHTDGLTGLISAMSGTGSFALLSLFVYRPLYRISKSPIAKQFCLLGIVQLSQEMFYWVFGSLIGSIPFPWRDCSLSIDPLYFAHSLSLDSFTYIIGLICMPLFLLSRKLNKQVLVDLNSIVSVQSKWKSTFILQTTKLYILLFQILNIVTFIL